ncbi:hypothetical protein, partial [uncultured Tateyamaria sp.]|uniref:hypothetical protein n=1 Tax=uncultured Tateyamaria sp. TaxID=455651 RepID=UPI00263A2A01
MTDTPEIGAGHGAGRVRTAEQAGLDQQQLQRHRQRMRTAADAGPSARGSVAQRQATHGVFREAIQQMPPLPMSTPQTPEGFAAGQPPAGEPQTLSDMHAIMTRMIEQVEQAQQPSR